MCFMLCDCALAVNRRPACESGGYAVYNGYVRTPRAPRAYQVPKAIVRTPSTGAMRSRFLPLGPPAMVTLKTLERALSIGSSLLRRAGALRRLRSRSTTFVALTSVNKLCSRLLELVEILG